MTVFVHISFINHPHLENSFNQTGGKDMGRMLAAKCFFNSKNYKRLNHCTGMGFKENII